MTEPAMKRTIRERVAALNADITAMTAVRDHYLGVARDMENPMMPSIERVAAPSPAKTRKRGPNTGIPQEYKVNREALNIVAAAGLAGITAPALAKAMSVPVGHRVTSSHIPEIHRPRVTQEAAVFLPHTAYGHGRTRIGHDRS